MAAERIPDVSRAVPRRGPVEWVESEGRITLLQRRKGNLRRSVLRLFGVPPVFKVHLDAIGSEAWRLIDGTRTAAQVKDELAQRFPAEPDMASRLGKFLGVMVSRGFVELG